MISIVNCVKGSFAWWHEKRHAYQERRWGLLSKWLVFSEWFLLLAALACLFKEWGFASFFVFSLFTVNYALEADADWFALKKTGNWRAWLRLSNVNEVKAK